MNLIKRTKQWIQSGKIMLEMLGVLALIGLLTLGFIFYQKALLADRVNRLMEDARLAGLVVLDGVYKKLTVNEELSLKGQFEQQTPYNFSAYLEGEGIRTFAVLVDSVPYDVCIEVKQRKPQWAEAIVANRIANVCYAEQDNLLAFFYNEELTNIEEGCTKDSDCGECGKCKNARCQYGFKNRSGTCFSCGVSSNVIEDVDPSECAKCKNRIYTPHQGGWCLSPLNEKINYWGGVSKSECEKLPNQYWVSSNSTCFYCKGTFNPSTGVCSTTDCSPKTHYVFGLSEATCTQCGGSFFTRELNGGFVGVCQGLPR